MAGISTHILDASIGQPVASVVVKLLYCQDGQYVLLAEKITDADGRIKSFDLSEVFKGDYQFVFEIADYFLNRKICSFYPRVCIDFSITEAGQHYHVPLLISPFSYSTYRGS